MSAWLAARWRATAGRAPAAPEPVRPRPTCSSTALARIPLPGGGALSSLPGEGDLLALTLDDGVNSDVVRLYTQFAKDTGVRLTYFVNGRYCVVDRQPRPAAAAGRVRQIQLGNHTWTHPDLATFPKDRVAEQLRRNHQFLLKTYGVDARPYFRPPYGSHNPIVDEVAGDLGYAATRCGPAPLEDQNVIPEGEIVKMANKYFNPQAIVIGHLNHLPVTHVYGQLADVISSRNLKPSRSTTSSHEPVQPNRPHQTLRHTRNIRLLFGAPIRVCQMIGI